MGTFINRVAAVALLAALAVMPGCGKEITKQDSSLNSSGSSQGQYKQKADDQYAGNAATGQNAQAQDAAGEEAPPSAASQLTQLSLDMATPTPTSPVAKSETQYEMGYAASASPSPMRKMAQTRAGYVGSGQIMPQPPPYPAPTQTYVGQDKFEHAKSNSIKIAADEPVSTFSIDTDTASYGFLRKAINDGHLPPKDSVRVEEMVNYFDYNYPTTHDKAKPFKATVAVYPTPWNKDTMLMHIGIKGMELAQSKKPKANLVFLIDVSGSMDEPDKLPLVKKSLLMLVDSLDANDTVGIVVYAGAAGTVLEPTEVRNKEKIRAAIKMLNAGGSTAGGEGVALAYSLAQANYEKSAINRVILATDGDFNVGTTNVNELQSFIERKRETGIFLSVLGFGMGNYNDELMQKLAQNGNGNAAFIDTLNEARKTLVTEAASTLFPIAKDVKIQVEFNPARVAEYRLIGYETRMLRREDFNNDKVDAGEIGSGHCVTAIYEITPVGSKGRMVDDLRYGKADKKKRDTSGGSDEYAFLKIRYKLPRGDKSSLMTLPIDGDNEYDSIKDVPVDIKFAAAVAAFGQMVKGEPFTAGYTYDDVAKLARAGKGEDEFGYRSEFINLVGLAKGAEAMRDGR